MTVGAAPPTSSSSLLPRPVLLLVGGAGAVIVGIGIKALGHIIATVMLALVLTIAVMPIASHLRRRGWPTWLSTLLAMAAAYLIVILLVVGVSTSIVRFAQALPTYVPDATQLKNELVDKLHSLGLAKDPTSTAANNLDLNKVVHMLTDLLNQLLGALSSAFFLVTVMFFVAMELPGLRARGKALRRTRPLLLDAFTEYVHVTQVYLIVTATFGAVVAAFDVVALYLLSVPLAFQWGILSFLTNFIPNIGFVIGVIPPAIMALVANGWQSMVAVIVVYSLLNVTIQTFIQPRIVGDSVGLGTTVTFLSLIVWTFLLGPLGALLAVPMTLLARAIFIDADPDQRWAMILLGQPPPEPAKASD